MFFMMLGTVSAMFFVAALVGKQKMNPERLIEEFRTDTDRECGLMAAVVPVRTGTMIMAAMGEICAVYGLVLYLISGDISHPFIFLTLSILHYPLTMAKLKKAHEQIEQLSCS